MKCIMERKHSLFSICLINTIKIKVIENMLAHIEELLHGEDIGLSYYQDYIVAKVLYVSLSFIEIGIL
jgi:hypothetical protein